MTEPEYEIERVRGRLDESLSSEILGFWADTGVLLGAEAQARLPEVVLVLRNDAGEIAGVNSVVSVEVPLVAGRRFWMYREATTAASETQRMIKATHEVLDEEFEQSPDATLGICAALAHPLGPALMAEWANPKFVFAGHVESAGVWISYFDGAKIGPGNTEVPEAIRELGAGYEVLPMQEQSKVSAEDAKKLWIEQTGMPEAEADRRAGELLMVVIDSEGALVAVSTAYLSELAQVGADMWHVRGFVSSGHRETANIGVALAKDSIEYLDGRFASGADTRAPGMLFEIENDGLKRYFNDGHWVPPSKVTFIGENGRGDHVRVRWFRGAEAPMAGSL